MGSEPHPPASPVPPPHRGGLSYVTLHRTVSPQRGGLGSGGVCIAVVLWQQEKLYERRKLHETPKRAKIYCSRPGRIAVDTSGGSLRAEIGATIEPDDKSPWKLDLNLAGFAGKKQGLTGGVSVAFMF